MMNINDFRKIVNSNIKADKIELKKFILGKLSNLPIPTVQVNTNTYIERAVIISKDKEKFNLDRLSYIPEKLKGLVKEGRFNNASEPIFYAAFTDLEFPSATRYFLATELDHSLLKKQNKTFNITITKWLSNNGFTSIFFVFKDNYCTNSLTKNAFKKITNSKEYKEISIEDKEFIELITDELAKSQSANNYTITNIVFDFYKEKGYKSIIYPGVRSRYRGNNIAMLPDVIDENWNCKFGAEFKLTQNEDNINVEAIYYIDINENKLLYRYFEDDEIGEEISIDK